MESKKTIVKVVLTLMALVAIAPLVVADSYSLYCLEEGEQLDLGELCNPLMPTITGPTSLCVRLYDTGQTCPANINTCNSMSLTCGSAANTTIDQDPPELTVTSPAQDGVYTERSLPLAFTLNERSTVYYKDNNSPNQQWRLGCSDCLSYSNPRTFDEGFNDLTFRATDRNGNQVFFDVDFRIDSSDPRVLKTEPRRGFASGEFYVEFREENPEMIRFHYGNVVNGMFEHTVDIGDECQDSGSTKTECTTAVDLSLFDGQEISYYAELIDIAGNVDMSTEREVSVDYSDPVVLDFDYDIDGRFVTFVMDLDEANLDEVNYIDLNDDNPRERRLCSRLDGSICERRVSFRDGDHIVEISVLDEAGNSVSFDVSFFTDSRDPRIMRTEPRRGFASGLFSTQFSEDNPEETLLHYGNFVTGMRDAPVDLDSCFEDRGRINCDITVDLEDYDGQEIEYYFTVEDRVGNIDMSRSVDLEVDVTFPEILSISHSMYSSTRAEVVMMLDEDNLDEVVYTNNNAPFPRERRFCSRLEEDGSCDRRIYLYEGVNSIDFMVIDEAGNAVAQNYEIVI